MDKTKESTFRKLFGDKIGDMILGTSKQVADAAEDAGLRSKAVTAPADAAAAAAPAGDAANGAATGLERKLSELTVKEFADALGTTMKEALAPLLQQQTAKETSTSAKLAEITDGMQVLAEGIGTRLDETDKAVKTLLGEAPASVKSAGFRASNGGPLVTSKQAGDAMPTADASLKSLVDQLDLGMRKS